METTVPQRPTRKVHDAWALVLFAVVTATSNALMVFRDHAKLHQASLGVLYRASTSAVLFLLGFVALTLIAFRFFTRPVLHFGFLASIAFYVAVALASGSALGLVLGLVAAGFSAYMYVHWGLKYIPFTAIVLRGGTSIVLGHGLSVLAVEVLVSVLFLGQLALTLLALLSTDTKAGLYFHVLFFFELFWFQANAVYFFMVFIASITVVHIFNAGRPARNFIESFSNTLYAAGSICLGGLLLAVVQVLRYMLHLAGAEDREREQSQRSFLSRILAFVIEIVLVFLEEVIRLANDWVFVYIAIYGKSYKKALEESFEKATEPGNSMLINTLIVDKTLWFLGILSSLFYLFTLGIFIDLKLAVSNGSYLEIGLPTVFVVFFLTTFMSIFSSATKSVLFAYAEKPDCVEKVLPEVRAGIKKLGESAK